MDGLLRSEEEEEKEPEEWFTKRQSPEEQRMVSEVAQKQRRQLNKDSAS